MPNILITRLAVGESLKMRAFAKKYVGREHTKWSPVCGVIFNQQDNGYKFTVETIKSVPTMYILQAGASILQNNLKLAKTLGAEVVTIQAENVVEALVTFASAHHVKHAIFGKSRKSLLLERLTGSLVLEFIHDSVGVDVHIMTTTGEEEP